MEIAIISTREVIYESSLQKLGKIKVTLKISQNFSTWNLDVKYFGLREIQNESGTILQSEILKEKSLVKSDQEINGLFQAIGVSIAQNEFPQKFYEIQRQALLMYVQNDLIDGVNCIFGLKPNEWVVYESN
jgi:hypothetical protein